MTTIKALLLAAGFGTRLKPLTNLWPKCLMPVHEHPILEYWLSTLYQNNITNVIVNTHHHSDAVSAFLKRERFDDWVTPVFEEKLLGTAGTIRRNSQFFKGHTTLLAHADNWCNCRFDKFLEYHYKKRPDDSVMTMMTFRSDSPQSCGVVELDSRGVVTHLHEKVQNPPSNLANGAVYLFETDVLDWLLTHHDVTDFSTEVIPNFVGKIATWENRCVHRDIGMLPNLLRAQTDTPPDLYWREIDTWQKDFRSHLIHQKLRELSLEQSASED